MNRTDTRRVAVVGAGPGGAACAASLRRAGFDVTVFDKSSGVGGRMATLGLSWTDADEQPRLAEFDLGCGQFTVTRPRFRAVIERAVAKGAATHWRQQVYAPFPGARSRQVVVPTPDMPALCRHLLEGVPLRLDHTVTGLRRGPDGWGLRLGDGGPSDRLEGPFDQVVLAVPAAQAARLLNGHRTAWAEALATVRSTPCWTLMAVTDDLDWPWDAASLDRGILSRIARNDRKPGRPASSGLVPWVAHATPAWSLAHLEEDPVQVETVLREALGKLLSSAGPVRWHPGSVHRWRHARHARLASGELDCFWNAALGLGVCGDWFGDGNVEAAWHSGDELADTIAASFDTVPVASVAPEHGRAVARDMVDTAH